MLHNILLKKKGQSRYSVLVLCMGILWDLHLSDVQSVQLTQLIPKNDRIISYVVTAMDHLPLVTTLSETTQSN